MTQPTITFDVGPMVRFLDDTRVRQMPFALSLALNATANDMQRAIRNRVEGGRGFTIRSNASRQFLLRQIRRNRGEDFATKRSLVARVRIQNKGTGSASLLSLIDQGGLRTSRFAIDPSITQAKDLPIPQRATPTAKISRTLYPGRLNLKRTGKALRGDRRTFVVKTATGDTLLLQRRGKRVVRTLFVLQRSANMRARNFFAPAAESAAITRFDLNLQAGLRRALETAR